jgi:transketolase
MNKLIKKIVDIATLKKEGHIPSSLSILDIMYVLYDKVLDVDSIKENKIYRDRFILSKGHASLGLYVTLDHFGLLKDDLNTFCDVNSKLGGHPTDKIFGVESSTGSLGHGLPIGVGLALASKIKKYKNKVYVIVGDGEANEGTIWESALLAKHHNLDNLYCIIDFNHSTDRAIDLGNLYMKFSSFGWDVIEINGHDHNQIEAALTYSSTKPICIIANTIKGKGLSMIENNPEWHHKFPTEEEYQKMINELNNNL